MKVLGWYVVDKNNLAMACANEKDATLNAAQSDAEFPKSQPHRAVLLAEIEEAGVATGTNQQE